MKHKPVVKRKILYHWLFEKKKTEEQLKQAMQGFSLLSDCI